MWVYINGRLFAFQAKDAGSNPATHNNSIISTLG
jgi:hypothetical protein